jgi:hypothetical protein
VLDAFIDLAATLLATAAVMVLPGAALLGALGAWRSIDVFLRPAAAVAATIALASVGLLLTLWSHGSLHRMELGLGVVTLVLGAIALVRWHPGRGDGAMRELAWSAIPGVLLALLALVDSPHVRSDTYWHVALARKLESLHHLSSSAIAFEAGTHGNANYPLPVWHALIAVAADAPRVDLWSATWFMTVWLAPVAMLAFAGMARTLLGERRIGTAASWTFLAVVVLGYGPWFFASRYLSYAGQVAIYLVLPIIVAAFVQFGATRGRARMGQLAIAAAGTVLMGLLHGNYVLYPVLFAAGGAALLLLGRREGWGASLLAAVVVGAAGAASLGVQLPWITDDDNFLRGGTPPAGEPTAFIRHRDAFSGTPHSFHVALGLLDSQPLLVLGTLALPVVLLLLRRRRGPWTLAGAAVAMVAFGRSPQLVQLIDHLGSVTPATRFDRVYPAAVGVLGALLGGGVLLARLRARGQGAWLAACAIAVACTAAATWWLDSIRDTRRIPVTPFVEARWVGGLDPRHLPLWAIAAASVAIVLVAAWIRLRARDTAFERETRTGDGAAARLAIVLAAAIVLGLTPASIRRLHDTSWHPEAYSPAKRQDSTFTRIEVYPAGARRAISGFEPGSVVLAAFNDTRRIASLAPVYSIEESRLRELTASPPKAGADARRTLDQLVAEWHVDYVAASSFDPTFRTMLDAAAADPAKYQRIRAGSLRVFRVRHDGDSSAGA